MSSLGIASLMFGCVFVSTLLAIWISRRLPPHHLEGESRDVVKTGMGVIATLTALVLGLLVASTKATYDAQSGMVNELASQMALFDRVLARYGTDAVELRSQLKTLAQGTLDQLWPQGQAVELSGGKTRIIGESLYDAIVALQPKTDAQKALQSRALDILVGLGQTRQRLVVNNERNIPAVLLGILGLWQAVLFAGYGLISPRNATTFVVLTICMISVSAALFVVMELDRPFEGMIRISDAPLRTVLSHLGE